jgi:hypothetical protein
MIGNQLTAYKIDYKATPRSRKVITGIQFHPSAEVASELKSIRQYDPEATLVSVRPCTQDEVSSMVAGWNPFG